MAEHRDGRRYPHDADNKAVVYEDERGHLWVTHQELLDCGYINLADFDIVYLNEKFYELQAHMHKPDSWWVEEVDDRTTETELEYYGPILERLKDDDGEA